MLMPSNAAGRKYMVIGYPQRSGGLSQYVISRDDTKVTVTPTADIKAGNGVNALSAGQQYTFTLKQYDVLNLDTKNDFSDITGTIITADHAVSVYSGNICENVPLETCKDGRCQFEPTGKVCSSNRDCPIVNACDHLEQQLFPLKAVGKKYVISKSWERGEVPDMERVMAVEDQTTIQVLPNIIQLPVLNKGAHFDFEIDKSVVLSADKPIVVAKFLESEDAPGADHEACEDMLLYKIG